MRDNYDFSESVQNPYTANKKQQITIRIDESTVSYFKDLSQKNGIPYQTLINLYLSDCAKHRKEIEMTWK